jgi:hypothetical protein
VHDLGYTRDDEIMIIAPSQCLILLFQTYSYAETQHMLNLESSPQQLAATNNMDHPVKSNMIIINAGVASKDNDQVSISLRVFITTEYCKF